jgi:site-specific DNA-methyltransferase (adenine-specific)
MLTITNEDNMELMARYSDNYFDLAIVDPPYGIGMDNQKVRTKPNRPNTYLRANENQYNISNWDNEIPKIEYFNELFRVSKNQIIWGANYFCEFIPNGKGWIYWDKQMGDNNFSSGEFAFQSFQIKSSSYSFPSIRDAGFGGRIHPTQKPVALYKWLLDKYAQQGNKILDTHLGSGSIAIACHDYGFDLTACELDKEYFDKAMQRINNHTAQTKLFV